MRATRRFLALRGAAAVGVATALALALPMSAAADSPIISASGGQCQAQWKSGPNDFRIRDADNNDNDWCYVDYSWESDHEPSSRVSHPQDRNTAWENYHISNPQGRPTVYWKVCKERQDDPDVCSNWRSDAT